MTGARDRQRRRLMDDWREFRHAHASACAEFGYAPGAFVPARKLPMTGLILHDLERAGFIERAGDSFAPAR